MPVRLLTPQDIDFALSQIHREGWVPSRAVFESIVEHDPQGCFIAEIDGKRAAMLTTANFGPTGWIGHLIVPPEFRKQGVRTIRLEADPPGMGIYQRLS